MNKELKAKALKDLTDEAALWFIDGSSGREVDEDYAKPFYWGPEDQEKRAISFIDFHFAVLARVDKINRAFYDYKQSRG